MNQVLLKSLRRIALTATALAITTAGAHAAPVTWLFTGTAEGVVTSGDSLNDVSNGDIFTLKYTFDDAQAPDVNASFYKDWRSGNVSEVSINGMTFTVADSTPLGSRGARQVVTINNPFTGIWDNVTDTKADYTVGNGGFATSNLAGALHVQISWALFATFASQFPSGVAFMPDEIVLGDWYKRDFLFQVVGQTQFDVISFGQIPNAFTTWELVGAPAPGAMALLGLGLLGFGATRRRTI